MPYKDKKVNAECKRRWQLSNKEDLKQYQREWYLANKERIQAESKVKYNLNPELRKKRAKESYIKHKDKRKAHYKEFSRTVEGRYIGLKSQAKQRDIKVELTLEEFREIVTDKLCTYCEQTISMTGAGLDRIDSNLGYTKTNVTPSCRDCNCAKRELPLEKFEEHIVRMYETLQRKISKVNGQGKA